MKLLKLVPDNTNIHFLKWRVPFYLGSLLLMAASLGLVFTKGLNLGVDFVGGQMIRVTFERSAEAPWPTCAAKWPSSAMVSRSSSAMASPTRSRSG
jgi:preprotein translocase subunit SecF